MRNSVEQGRRRNSRRLWAAFALLLLSACLIVVVFAQQQRRRRVVAGSERASSNAGSSVINVKAGSDLQKALKNARPGDTLLLEPGAEFIGSFTLPAKTGDAYITVRSAASDASLPVPGERITPAYATMLPKIVSPGQGAAALLTEKGAHHYRFIGIEFKPANASAFVYDLIQLGDGSKAQNSLDGVPHHLILDRCYIHGAPDAYLKRGVALNSAETEIINSYISDCKAKGQDSQSIMGFNGPGPFKIINNYLEGAGENIMFGGAEPSIPNLVPSDIEVRGNFLTKPLAWRGVWSVKNLFELKNARRVVVDGNVMEHNWSDGQDGTAVLFTVRAEDGRTPWATIEDVEFINNRVRGAGGIFNFYGSEGRGGHRVIVRNNVFDDIDAQKWKGGGQFMTATQWDGIVVEHNTILNSGNITKAYGLPVTGFVFRNNVVVSNAYGFQGDGHASGSDSLNTYFPKSIVSHNAIIGGDASISKDRNMFPISLKALKFVNMDAGDYRLRPDSPLKKAASDGTDIGANSDSQALAVR